MTKIIKTLALGSGGLRGIYHLSVLEVFEDLNLIKDITKYAGCSIGSLICVLYIVGYTPKEMLELFNQFTINDMFEINAKNILQFPKTYGIESGTKYGHYIKDCLSKKDCNPYITLGEFYQKYNKHLVITVTNISDRKLEVFDHISAPDIPVWIAIKMSCAVPFVFQPVEHLGKLYVDGAVIGDLPLGLTDNPDETVIFNLQDNIEPTDIYTYVCSLIRCVQHESYNYAKNNYPKSCFFFDLSYTDFMTDDKKSIDSIKTSHLFENNKVKIKELMVNHLKEEVSTEEQVEVEKEVEVEVEAINPIINNTKTINENDNKS